MKILIESWFKTCKYKTIFLTFRKLKMQKKPIFKQKSCQNMQFLLKLYFLRFEIWKDFGRKTDKNIFSKFSLKETE